MAKAPKYVPQTDFEKRLERGIEAAVNPVRPIPLRVLWKHVKIGMGIMLKATWKLLTGRGA
jgi:hypothetical protein